MEPLTQPLRDEHRELLPHIELLRSVADSVEEVPIEVLRGGVNEAYAFLTEHLIPHAQAEDRVLYPAIEQILGAPGATATMSRDHLEVGMLTEELGVLRTALASRALSPEQAKGLRRVLYGLYALVKVHFAKEEEVYLPLLDMRLTPETAHDLFAAMSPAAHEMHHH